MRLSKVAAIGGLVLAAIVAGCFTRSDEPRMERSRLEQTSVNAASVGGGGEAFRKSVSPSNELEGDIVDPNVQFIDAAVPSVPALAFDGTNYVVAFVDRRSSDKLPLGVVTARFSESGAAIGGVRTISSVTKVREQTFLQSSPSYPEVSILKVAASPAGTIVAWVAGAYNEEASVFAVRIAPDGAVIDDIPIRITTPARRYRSALSGYQTAVEDPLLLSADSEGFRVAVVEPHPGGGLDIESYRVSLSGVSNPVGPANPLATSLSEIFRSGEAVLAASAAGGIFAWPEPYPNDGGSYGVRVNIARVSNVASSPSVTSLPLDDHQSIAGGFIAAGTPYLVTRGYADGESKMSVVHLTNEGGTTSITKFGGEFEYANRIAFNGAHIVSAKGSCLQKYELTGALAGGCEPFAIDPLRNPGAYFGDNGFVSGKTTYADVGSKKDGGGTLVGVISQTDLSIVAPANVSRTGNAQTAARIASNGSEYVAVWRDDRHTTTSLEQGGGYAIYAARIAADGVVSASVRVSEHAVSENAAPRVIFDGSKYFVVWRELDPSTYFDPYYRDAPANVAAAVLSASGPVVVESRLRVAMQATRAQPTVTSDGVNRVVAFVASIADSGKGEEFGPIEVVRVSIANDAVLDAVPATVAVSNLTFRTPPVAANNGSKTLIAWQQVDLTTLGVSLQAVDLAPGAVQPVAPARAVVVDIRGEMAGLELASDERGFMAAWSAPTSDDGRSEIRGQLLDEGGATLGSAFSIAAPSVDGADPTVTYARDGSNYLVAWSNSRDASNYDIHAAWVDRFTGKVKDIGGVPFASLPATQESLPAVAASRDGKGRILYQRFDRSAAANAYRIVSRTFESGRLLGEACNEGDPCASRYCADGVCCTAPCDDGCGVCNATPGQCTPKAQGTACGRGGAFLCDGSRTTCPEACSMNADCREGHVCVSNYCEPRSLVCPSEFEGFDPNGVVVACGDLKCRSGACLARCGSIDDCRVGLVCDFDGRCVVPPEPENRLGCSVALSGSSRGGPLHLLGIGLCVALAAARRVRRDGDSR